MTNPLQQEERLRRIEQNIRTIIDMLSSMQRNHSEERLLKDTEVAEKLSVTRNTVWKQAKAGIIPKPVRHGIGAVRWKLSEINAYIANLERISTAGGEQ